MGLCWNFNDSSVLNLLNVAVGFGVVLITLWLKNLHFELAMGGGSDLFATPKDFPIRKPDKEQSSVRRLRISCETTIAWPP